MVNWSESMQRSFEYYIVDPNTWADVKPLTNVKSCTISRDSEADTPQWGFKNYTNKESAIKDAKFLAKLADEEIDEEQLRRFGFEIV